MTGYPRFRHGQWELQEPPAAVTGRRVDWNPGEVETAVGQALDRLTFVEADDGTWSRNWPSPAMVARHLSDLGFLRQAKEPT